MPPPVENQRSTESAAAEVCLEQISHLIEEKGYARAVQGIPAEGRSNPKRLTLLPGRAAGERELG